MKVWATFLLASFVVGGVSARRGKLERRWMLPLVSVLVAVALYSRRFA